MDFLNIDWFLLPSFLKYVCVCVSEKNTHEFVDMSHLWTYSLQLHLLGCVIMKEIPL